MTRSLDDIFGNNNNKPRTLDQIFAPPEPAQPKIDFFSAHAKAEQQPQSPLPNLVRSLNSGVANSLLGNVALKTIIGNSYDPKRLQYSPTTIPEKIAYGAGNIGTDMPIWMAGDAVLAKPLGALAKTAPVAKAINFLPKAITPALGTGIKAGVTYGGVIAPAETAIQGEGLQGLLQREKQVPLMSLGGVALHGAGQLIGKGIGEANNALLERKLSYPAIESNPLQDVRNAYRNPITLRDATQQQLNKTFTDATNNLGKTGPTLPSQGMTSEELLRQRQLDAQNAFGGPRDIKKYSFTTSEQRAFQNLQDGITEAQNYARHTDVLAPYPPGTTIEQAYADIKSNTGVDLPKLMDNWNKTQSLKNKMTPEELRLGRVSGVIPPLKPREGFPTQGVESPLPQRTIPEKPQPLQWTNKDNIQSAGPLPLRSITPDNLGRLPIGQKVGTDPILDSTTSIEMPIRNGGANQSAPFRSNRSVAANMESPASPNNPTISLPIDSTSPNSPSAPRIVSSLNKDKIPFMEKLQRVYRETVNNTQGIDRTTKGTGLTGADNPVVMTTNARNAGGTVDHIINNGLIDMSGKKVVNGSVSDAFKMPKEQQQAFDEYLYHLHNIDRMREGKPVFDGSTSIGESRKAIANLEVTHPEFKEKASIVRQTLDQLLNKWGVDSGMITPELRDVLQGMYKNYVPTYRSLEGANAIAAKSRSAGAAKIINKAVGGEEPLITLRESVPMLINKTVKAARKNEVYQGILNAARKNPENGFAKVLGEDVAASESLTNSVKADGLEGIAANSERALEADPKLGYLLTVMEKGNPIKVQINKELFDSLQALNKVDDTSLHQALQTVKKYATNPFKALITGYNPFFAIRNVARDIPTAYIQGTENNPFKFAGNLGSAAKDMVSGSQRYKEFQALGGQGSNFFNIEKGGIQTPGKLKKVGQKVGNVISSINNFTETLPRYGEYIGTIKRGGEGYSNKMQGLHNAAEVTVNFGRHGDLTKSADAVVPYLNPAFQGLDKFRKTLFKASSYPKAIGAITVPTAGIYALNQAVDKEGYDQLDNRTKDTYYVIPEGNGKFIKIAKTREAGVLFGTLFERIARTVEGQSGSFKGFANTLQTNFIPNDPISSNFFSPLINAKYTNKDFANREIVPSYMADYSPRYQYDEKTSEIAKTIGDKLNLSPKQIDYLIKSYTGVIGSLLLPATTKGGSTVGNVVSRNFTADAKYNNEIQNNFYDQMAGLRRTANDKNVSKGIPSKVVTQEEKQYNSMARVAKELTKIRKEQAKAQLSGDEERANLLQTQLLSKAKSATK